MGHWKTWEQRDCAMAQQSFFLLPHLLQMSQLLPVLPVCAWPWGLRGEWWCLHKQPAPPALHTGNLCWGPLCLGIYFPKAVIPHKSLQVFMDYPLASRGLPKEAAKCKGRAQCLSHRHHKYTFFPKRASVECARSAGPAAWPLQFSHGTTCFTGQI